MVRVRCGGGGSGDGRCLFLSELGFDGVVVVSRGGGGCLVERDLLGGGGGNRDFVRGFVVRGVVFGRRVDGGGGNLSGGGKAMMIGGVILSWGDGLEE